MTIPLPFVSVDNVSVHFGETAAVRNVSLTVERGTIFGLVGSDGAGKSTLLRMIATLIRPVSGTIRIDGLDSVSAKRQIKRRIGYMPQRFGLYHHRNIPP